MSVLGPGLDLTLGRVSAIIHPEGSRSSSSDSRPKRRYELPSRVRASRIVLGYILFAGLWIVLSDLVLDQLLPAGSRHTTAVAMLKGLVFVVFTAGLLWVSLRYERRLRYQSAARQVATTAALLGHFRAMSAKVSDAVLLVGAGGRIMEANTAAASLLGWSRATLCERRIGEVEVEVEGNMRPDGPRVGSYESIFRTADGRMLPVEVDCLTLQVGSQHLQQYIVREASLQRRTDENHRDRSWIDVFFDMPFIGMAISSPESKRWIRFNDRLCEILGYSRPELSKLTWREMTHPEDLDKDEQQFQRVMEGEIDAYSLEKRFIRKDDTEVHVELDVRGRRLADGTVDYLVATVQDITGRVEAEERLNRQKNLYAALSRINTAITRLPDRQQIFQDVCDVVVAIGRFEFAWIFSVSDGEFAFEAQAGDDKGFVGKIIDQFKAGPPDLFEQGAPMVALRTGRAVVRDPYMEDGATIPWRSLAAEANVEACGAFPIIVDERVAAVLTIYSSHSGDIDDDVVKLLEEMARDVSFALENRAREEARVANLAALEVAEARSRFALEGAGHGAWEWDLVQNRVNYAPRWKAMLGYTAEEISDSPLEWQERIHPDDAEATLALVQEHFAGRTASYVSEHRLRCKDGSYKWVLDRGQVLERTPDGKPVKFFGTKTDLTEVKAAEEALLQERQRMDLARASAKIGTWDFDIATGVVHLHQATPLLFGFDETPRSMSLEDYEQLAHPEDRAALRDSVEEMLGNDTDYATVFRFIWPDGSVHWIEDRGVLYRDHDGRPVSAFGINIDITERVESERRISEYVARLERSMLGTVDAISHMVDLRDPYTAGHEVRVGNLAAAIGRELGLDDMTCQGLQIIGRVHDIGKITIPAEILSKPGRLSDMEMNIVRTHAQQGFEILKDIEFDWPVAEVIRQHHERMDGSGYPRGLKGDEIMLEARIVAVADVVESMASHRPYRPARGVEPALEEIERNAGILYDEEVARACLRLFRETDFSLDGCGEPATPSGG